ncbi:hypothetical protein A3K80_07845 [Candidatus Bathyarchaeota archaeon RBG_13_38_9]|nr:MAG: hypothetical protein A3K80_07845 [Candidatus Bathyarchaeota archaeon RBG_13_38_9]
MARFCPECGGELTYDPVLKHNICKSCGLTFTPQQLMEAKDEIMDRRETTFDQRKKRQNEYLKWWLSKKD